MELSAGWHNVDSDDEWTEARFVAADGDKLQQEGGDFDRVSGTATVTGSTPRTPGTPSSRHSRRGGRVSPPAGGRASTALIVTVGGGNRVRRGKAVLLCNLNAMRLPTSVPRAVLEQRVMQVPNANPALMPIGQPTQHVGGALTATQLKVITAFTESKAPRTLMKSERAFNDRALQRQARSLHPRHGANPAMQHAARRHHAQQHHHFGHHTETRARFGGARSGEISTAPAFGGRR